MYGLDFNMILWPFTALVFVVGLMVPAKRMAVRYGLVDHPGGRKKHESTVPLVGGLVVFGIFLFTVMCAIPVAVLNEKGFFYFAFSLVMLLVMGAWDDRHEMTAWTRFFIQIAACSIVVIGGGAYFQTFGNLFGFGAFGLSFMAIPFAITASVLLVNAINLLDGLDGLSGGIGMAVFFWLAAGSYMAGSEVILTQLLILMAALCGFLFYNMRAPWRKKASVFIGDSGSLALGLSIAWFSLSLASDAQGNAIHPMAVAWILALPVWDICGQFARRLREGRHPFDADLDHFHHHLRAAGLSVGQASFFMAFIVFIFGAIGVIGTKAGVHDAVLTYPWIAGLFVHIYMSMHPQKFRALLSFVFAGRSKNA